MFYVIFLLARRMFVCAWMDAIPKAREFYGNHPCESGCAMQLEQIITNEYGEDYRSNFNWIFWAWRCRYYTNGCSIMISYPQAEQQNFLQTLFRKRKSKIIIGIHWILESINFNYCKWFSAIFVYLYPIIAYRNRQLKLIGRCAYKRVKENKLWTKLRYERDRSESPFNVHNEANSSCKTISAKDSSRAPCRRRLIYYYN